MSLINGISEMGEGRKGLKQGLHKICCTRSTRRESSNITSPEGWLSLTFNDIFIKDQSYVLRITDLWYLYQRPKL